MPIAVHAPRADTHGFLSLRSRPPAAPTTNAAAANGTAKNIPATKTNSSFPRRADRADPDRLCLMTKSHRFTDTHEHKTG
jgi:hypothetical protein